MNYWGFPTVDELAEEIKKNNLGLGDRYVVAPMHVIAGCLEDANSSGWADGYNHRIAQVAAWNTPPQGQAPF